MSRADELGGTDLTLDEEISDVRMKRPHVCILGAGASVAALPAGDRAGRRLPVMANFIETLGLDSLLSGRPGPGDVSDFEAMYSDLTSDPAAGEFRRRLETAIHRYFSQLELPSHPTIFDHLLMSLRPKDVVATFNWDPFLVDAFRRCQRLTSGRMPHMLFLHGNVRVAYCLDDRVKGLVGARCSRCDRTLSNSDLLYPVAQKDYAANGFISSEWETLRDALRGAFMVTIFGYGAPRSDVEAVSLMREAWGTPDERELEEFEFIDVAGEAVVRERWRDFVHSHHYAVHDDFYSSWIARHPRRTCETMWSQLIDARWVSDHSLPKEASLAELESWLRPLVSTES